MQQQEFLMVEDIYEAIRRACQAISVYHRPGKGKEWAKIVGHLLWPTKDPETAGKYLNGCLDKNRPEKLCIEEYLWIKREAKRSGCHILHEFDCNEVEYQRGNPIEPKDEVADLQTQYIKAAREMKVIAERLEARLTEKA